MSPADRDDPWTAAAVAALAFIAVNVLHEVVGHGAPYFIQGGHEALFTPARPVFEQRLSPQAGLWIDLWGPLAALLPGLAALWLAGRPGGAAARLFLTAFGAFALFWNLGYAPWSLLTETGDWNQISAALGDAPVLRWAVGLAGAVAWVAAAATVIRRIRRLGGAGPRARRLGRLLWLGGSAAAVLGGLFDPRGLVDGLAAAVPACALAALPLLFVGRGGEEPAQMPVVERGRVWQASALVATALYMLWFGPGVGVSL